MCRGDQQFNFAAHQAHCGILADRLLSRPELLQDSEPAFALQAGLPADAA